MTSGLSQSYFDETVVENEDVFDMSPEEAVAETIDQLFKQQQQQQQSLTLPDWKQQQRAWWGISLTHPTQSPQGQEDRKEQQEFRQALDSLLSFQQDDQTKHEPLRAVVEQIWNVFVRDERIIAQQQETNKAQPNTDNNANDNTPPVLLGNLFWQPSPTIHTNDNVSDIKDTAANNAPLMVKLAAFAASSSDTTNTRLALQVALKSLAVVGPRGVRRNRQEQLLRDFCLSCHGWERLFGNTHNNSTANTTTAGQQQEQQQLQLLWLQLIHNVCQGHEPNKKHCNSKPILKALVTTLQQQQQQQQKQGQQDNNNCQMAEATCRLITVLCRFDDFSSQATQGQATDSTGMVVSSAHSTVTTLAGMGIVTILYDLLTSLFAKQQQASPESSSSSDTRTTTALLAVLQSLRSLAIQDEIVVRMVSTGLLEVLQSIFQTYCSISTTTRPSIILSDNNENEQKDHDDQESLRLSILTALIGLYRNLSANDELKTTLCRSSQQSILGPLIASLQSLTAGRDGSAQPSSPSKSAAVSSSALTKLQEHVCATLGSMALRQPQNAQMIVQDYQGHLVILKAMQMSHYSPLVQRQGALAIRNLASRASSTVRESLLDAGAEPVLRKAATLGAVDEAYAALRDLGCHAVLLQSNPETGQLERQAMFGEGKPLQFRPVYD